MYPTVKITRVCGERDRALLFRGWSRLCLHAASAAEGASAATTATARATRAEEATDKAEASRRAEHEIENMTAGREQARRQTARGSNSAAELQHKMADTEAILREHQLRWIKILVRTVILYGECGGKKITLREGHE